MKGIRAVDIAKATGGVIIGGDPKALAKGISIDTREILPGMAFFALKGERVDGHSYIDEAILKGSEVVVYEKDVPGLENSGGQSSACLIKVQSTELALQKLAAWYLAKFDIFKIGITGSTGKTTTKDMLYNILSKKYKAVRNKGNLNNLIGLPLSIFQVDDETEVAVFEMGMDRIGEIHELSDIVRPDMAIITNVGVSHLARLGSRENILKAKKEIVDFMGSDGVLIVNSDDALLASEPYSGKFRTVRVGCDESSDFRITNVKDFGEGGIRFRIERDDDGQDFALNSLGTHNSANAGLAVAAASYLKVDHEMIKEGLLEFENAGGRLHIKQNKTIRIIDDTYNASPDSMKAAIDVLGAVKGVRKIAIFGDMFELGEEEKRYHEEVGEYASKTGIDVVISVGKNSEYISCGARKGGAQAFHFDSKEMLINVMSQWVRKGDALLVKGSRGMVMEEIVKHLEEIRIE